MQKEIIRYESSAEAAQKQVQKNSFENRQMLVQIEELEEKLQQAYNDLESYKSQLHSTDLVAKLNLTESKA